MTSYTDLIFKGYYILHRTDIAATNTLYAQLWKEYTLSDSRYLTLDVFTVCVETITVVCTYAGIGRFASLLSSRSRFLPPPGPGPCDAHPHLPISSAYAGFLV